MFEVIEVYSGLKARQLRQRIHLVLHRSFVLLVLSSRCLVRQFAKELLKSG
jgi:hypothetical protein